MNLNSILKFWVTDYVLKHSQHLLRIASLLFILTFKNKTPFLRCALWRVKTSIHSAVIILILVMCWALESGLYNAEKSQPLIEKTDTYGLKQSDKVCSKTCIKDWATEGGGWGGPQRSWQLSYVGLEGSLPLWERRKRLRSPCPSPSTQGRSLETLQSDPLSKYVRSQRGHYSTYLCGYLPPSVLSQSVYSPGALGVKKQMG